MDFIPTALPGVLIIEPDVFKDERGFFLESFQERKYREGGIEGPFVQDNHSRSAKRTLRGLHAQLKHPQGKLVPALRQVDFFLMAKNPLEHSIMGGIIKKIRNIPQVLAAYEIDPSGTKDIDLLLGEMELHLMTAGKNQAS